jgi:hypothetical protein
MTTCGIKSCDGGVWFVKPRRAAAHRANCAARRAGRLPTAMTGEQSRELRGDVGASPGADHGSIDPESSVSRHDARRRFGLRWRCPGLHRSIPGDAGRFVIPKYTLSNPSDSVTFPKRN